MYVPQLIYNMLSVSILDRRGLGIQFQNGKCQVIQEGEMYVEAHLTNGVYETNLSEPQSACVAQFCQKNDTDTEGLAMETSKP